jgi:hypothetical protein
MMAHACNPNTKEAEWEDHKVEASLGYTERSHLIKQANNQTTIKKNQKDIESDLTLSENLISIHF